MDLNLIYITASSMDEAKAIAKELVSSRLVACVNIIDNITSVYWWEGAIQEGPEVVVIAKTRQVLVSRVIEKVKSVHSYECPCVVSLPISDGNNAFLTWVENETEARKLEGEKLGG